MTTACFPILLAFGNGGWIALAVVALLLAMEAFYSGSETGIYSINRLRLQLLADEGKRTALIWRKLLTDPTGLIIVTLIGTNVCVSVVTNLVTGLYFQAGNAGMAEFYATITLTPIIFVFGEVIPKNLFTRLADRFCYRVAWPLQASSWLFRGTGLVHLLKGISFVAIRMTGGGKRGKDQVRSRRREMTGLLADVTAEGLLSGTQNELARRVLAMEDLTLDAAVIPLENVAMVADDGTAEQIIETIRGNKYRRLPVYHEHREQIAGVLNVYDYLWQRDAADGKPPSPKSLMTPPIMLAQHMTVSTALVRLQRAKRSMAVVTDDRGGAVGIITMKDLVEQIIGELEQW